MEVPDTATVRKLLPPTLDLGGYGYPPPVGGDPDPLDPFVAVAGGLLPGILGWPDLASIPPAKEPVARMALAGLALRSALDFTPDRLETLADFDLLQSFSAGSYSETRRSADDAAKAQKLGLTGWPWLDYLLRGAMGPERLEELQALEQGVNAPAESVDEVAWVGGSGEEFGPIDFRSIDGWLGSTDPRV